LGGAGSGAGGLSSLISGISGLASSIGGLFSKSNVLKATSIKEVKPEIRPNANAKRVQMKYGPFTIKGRKSNV